MKVYAIIPVNLEYNDQTYDVIGYEPPIEVYTDKSKALQEMNKLDEKRRLQFNKRDLDEFWDQPLYELITLDINE